MTSANKSRLGGVIFLISGSGVAYWQYTSILKKISEQAPEVTLSKTIPCLSLAFAILGLMCILFGENVQKYSKSLKGRKKNFKDIVFFSIILIPGLVFYLYLKSKMQEMGYQF